MELIIRLGNSGPVHPSIDQHTDQCDHSGLVPVRWTGFDPLTSLKLPAIYGLAHALGPLKKLCWFWSWLRRHCGLGYSDLWGNSWGIHASWSLRGWISGWSSFDALFSDQIIASIFLLMIFFFLLPLSLVAPHLLFSEDLSIFHWFVNLMLFSLVVACFRWCIPYLQLSHISHNRHWFFTPDELLQNICLSTRPIAATPWRARLEKEV